MSSLALRLLAAQQFAQGPSTNLYMWGDNTYGQMGVNATPSYYSWSQLSSGGSHTVAIRNDGLLFAWGSNVMGQLGDSTTIDKNSPVQIGVSSWSQISAGKAHTIGILSDGSLWAWGNNTYNQLNNYLLPNSSYPVLISSESWSQISAGGIHNTAIKPDGSLWTWGSNTSGQLGMNNVFTNLTIGTSHYAAIRADGTLWTGGFNQWGQLGDGTTVTKNFSDIPSVQIPGSWSLVRAAGDTTFAVRSEDSTLWVWGANTTGVLGLNDTVHRSAPVQIPGVSNVVQLEGMTDGAGQAFIWRDSSSRVFGMGYNLTGGLSDGTGAARSSPVQITATPRADSLSIGVSHGVVISTNGNLWAWGRNTFGAFGTNDTVDSISPVLINTNTWISIKSGYGTTFGIRSDYTLWAWGAGGTGTLADNTTTNKSSPVQIGTDSWAQISAYSYALAIKIDGTLWAWGNNIYGNLGDGTTIDRSSPVQIGTSRWTSVRSTAGGSSAAIDINGKLYTWGRNHFGQLGDNTTINKSSPTQLGTSSWSQISAGISSMHMLGISADRLFAWGLNTNGQLGDTTTVNKSSPIQIGASSWVAVSAGGSHTVAIKLTNLMYAWGINNSGQLGDSTTIDRSSPVQLGASLWSMVDTSTRNSFAVRQDSTVWAWGANDTTYGYLGDNTTIAKSSPVQVAVPSIIRGLKTITAGGQNFGGLDFGNKLWVWGNGANGGRGDGVTTNKSIATVVMTDKFWSSIKFGQGQGFGIDYQSKLWVWGWNNAGQLGDGTTIDKSSPIQLGTSNWSQLAVSNSFPNVVGVTADNTLWGWGSNRFNMLATGEGTTISRSSPVQIGNFGSIDWLGVSPQEFGLFQANGTVYALGGTRAATLLGISKASVVPNLNLQYQHLAKVGNSSYSLVSAGDAHTTAITTDNRLFTWGDNSQGKLGDLTFVTRSSPVQITGSWTKVSSGGSHTIALDSQNLLYSFGSNYSGQLGTNTGNTTQTWTKVHDGGDHILAIRSDNTLWSWGKNNAGQLGDGTNVTRSSPVQIAGAWSNVTGGLRHVLATKTDGSLYAWGSNIYGQLGLGYTASKHQWKQIALGPMAYGIAQDDTLWGWGLNTSGQLGDSTVITRSHPVQIGIDKWEQIAIGNDHVIGKKLDGTIWTWGSNGSGELGVLDVTSRSSPVLVPNLPTISKVFAGAAVSAALSTNNTLYIWGFNTTGGQLGDNSIISRSSPVLFGTLPVKDVTFTSNATFVITTDNSLYAIGINNQGQLGDGTTINRSSPVQIAGSWSKIVGLESAIGLRTDGTLWAWGRNNEGQLGLGDTINRSRPELIAAGSSWTAVNAFSYATMAQKLDGTIWVWGRNLEGQLGFGDLTSRSIPTQLSGFTSGTDIYKVVTYASPNMGIIDQTNVLYMWGPNQNGQIGDGTTQARSIPTQVEIYANVSSPTQVTAGSWSQVAAGGYHSLAVKNDGSLYTWGLNDRGQAAGAGSLNTMTWSKFSGDATQSYGIRSDGTLWSWGLNTFGQLGQINTVNRSSPVQIGVNTYTDIAAGDAHALAITTDGKLFGWGKNDFGQAGALSWTQFTSGSDAFTVAIRSDGGLFTWGYNANGQLGDNTTVTRSSPVQVGVDSWSQVVSSASHTLANRSDGYLFAWGSNLQGQLGDGTTINRSAPVQLGVNYPSLAFNGINEYYTMAPNTGLAFAAGDWTIEMWIMPTAYPPAGINAAQIYDTRPTGTGSTVNYQLINLSSSGMLSYSSGTVVAFGGNAPLNVWTHFAVSRQGTNTKLFVNGVQVGTTATDSTTYIVGASRPVLGTDGNVLNSAGYSFAGYMSNIRVVKGVAVYTGNFTIPTGPLTATQSSGTNIQAITAGQTSLLTGQALLDRSGSNVIITAFGTSVSSTLTPFNTLSTNKFLNNKQLGAASGLSLAITSDNSLWVWGNNTAGQLGQSNTITRSSPVQVAGTWSKISAQNSMAAAIDTSGQLYTWGQNTQGMLGDGTTIARSSPVQIAGSWSTVAVGGLHTLAITNTNTMYAWGLNATTQLGLGYNDTMSRSSPVQVGTSNSWTTVLASLSSSAAINTEGKLYTWGWNVAGQLGVPRISYTLVNGGNSYIRSDGRLYVWGNALIGNGTLGDGTTIGKSSPIQLGTASWIFVDSFYPDNQFRVGIQQDYTLWTWGLNTSGELGDGTTIARSSPVQIAGSWSKVSAGFNYTLAQRVDGTLWAWGNNSLSSLGDGTTINRSSPVQISTSITSWSQISAGYGNNLALTTSGMMYGWGQNSSGQILPIPLSFTQIGNALVLRSDGQLWMWGANGGGPLGDGTVANRSSPVQVPGTWKAATTTGQGSSAYNTIAIRNDGTLWSWGSNVYGSLGNGTTISRSSPVQVGSDTDWLATATQNNSDAQFAIKTNNTLWTWGQNAYGVTGDSTTVMRSSPVQIAGSWSQVISDSNNVFAIDMQSRLYTWGLNNYGQLGTNDTVNRSSPVQLPGSWTKVSTAYNSVAAIDTLGRLYTWGWAQNGRLGNSTTIDRSSPVQIGTSSWSVVGMTYGACAAITIDGKLFTWGGSNVLGDNSANSRSSPVQVGTSSWTNVASGYFAQLAVNVNNTLYTWSSIGVQVGDNTTVSKNSPVLTASTNLNLSSVLVPSFSSPMLIGTSSWVQVSAGSLYSMAIKSGDRSLWSWGVGTHGVLGHGLTTSRSSPVQIGVLSWSMVDAGNSLAAAITTTGGLYTWGLGLLGGLGSGATASRSAPVQVGLSSWSMISTGGYTNAIGLDANNNLFTWGTGDYGSLGDGTTVTKSSPVLLSSLDTVVYRPTLVNNSSWSQVIAGSQTMLGVTSSEPFLYAWGLNTSGQLGDNSTVNKSSPTQVASGPLIIHRSSPVQIASGSWSQVTAGISFSGAIRSDGKLFMWGNNTSGQIGDSTTLNRSFPVQIGNNTWTEIGSGSSHAVAIDATNVVYAWGNNLFAQLGQGDQQSRSSPVQVTTSSFAHLSSGSNHVVGLIGNAIYGWGDNSFGQLGKTLAPTTWDSVNIGITSFGLRNNKLYVWGTPWTASAPGFGDNTTQYRSSPVQIGTTSENYLLIAQQSGSGSNSMIAYKQDNTLWAWGNNAGGQIGDGTTVTRSSPVQVLLNETGISKIIVSTSWASALSSGGTLYTWGLNSNFQLGNNSNVSRSAPVQIASNVRDFALTDASGAYIKNDNTLWVWGLNNNGQLGLNDTLNRSSPVQLGTNSWSRVVGQANNFAFLRLDGTIWSSGFNTSGQTGDNTVINRSSPVQVASGGIWKDLTASGGGVGSFMAKKTDNSIWAWGYNTLGVLGDGTTAARSQPVQILSSDVNASFTAQSSLWFSVTIGGSLYAWGSNNQGYLGDSTLISRSNPTQVGFINDSQQKTLALLDSNNYTKVSAGLSHTVALRSNGTAWVFGQGTNGQLGQVTNTIHRSSPTQVNAGQSYNTVFGLGLQTRVISDSAMFAMGFNTAGALGDNTVAARSSPVQLTSTSSIRYVLPLRVGLSSWTNVRAGYSHSAAIRSDNTLWTWGYGISGALGEGLTLSRSSPVQVGTSAWTSIALGNAFTTAIRNDNTLWTWGLNTSGQLGQNTTAARSSPVQLPGLWKDSEAAGTYAGAIAHNGTVWIWGANGSGVLGNNTLVARSSPVQVGIDTFKALSLSENSIAAIDTYSNIDTWGDNLYGQLGNSANYYSWSQLSGGLSHAMAIRSDGTLWGWGYNLSGQLGNNSTAYSSSPAQIGTNSWLTVSAGGSHTIAIRADNTTWVWGRNYEGMLGDNTNINRSSPIQISTSFTNVTAGILHTLATTSDGTLFAWGYNVSGQLGIYDGVSRSSPTQVPTSVKFNSISGGSGHSLGIATDNTLYGWGLNSSGQVGLSANVFTVSGLNDTFNYPGFITSQGKLYAWGSNFSGGLGDGTTISKSSPVQVGTDTNWSRIMPVWTDFRNSALFKTDNTLWVMGLNQDGQLGDGTTISRSSPVQLPAGVGRSWITYAAGTAYSIGVKDDGTMWTVGGNSTGVLGDSTTISKSSPVQVAGTWQKVAIANGATAFAIKPDGTLWSWGSGNLGALGNGTTIYRSSPVQIGVGTSFTQVVASDNAAHAIDTLGRLYAWGWNSGGKLGDNSTVNKSGLTQILGSWTAIASGSTSSIAIRTDGTLWGWGQQAVGVTQLGDGTTITRSSPVQITGGGAAAYAGSWTNVYAVDALTYAARRIDGTIWSWGTNVGLNTMTAYSSPILIIGSTPNAINEPTQVSTSTWNAISAGTTHSTAIRSDGGLFTWGSNTNGQLGVNYSLLQVSAGLYTVGAILSNGYVWATGNGSFGGIGDRFAVDRSSPVQISTTIKFKSLAYNTYTSLAIAEDNTLYIWGRNDAGQLGFGDTVNRLSPVQLGASTWLKIATGSGLGPTLVSTYGIKTDNTLWAWGYNASGQLGDGTTVSRSSPVQIAGSWTDVYAGGLFAAAKKANNTLWIWGFNTTGQLGDNTTVAKSSPIQVPGSWSLVTSGTTNSHTVALRSDGLLFGWGLNNSGQLGDNTIVNRSSPVQVGIGRVWSDISAGDAHTGALSNNLLFTWGSNSQGNVGDITIVNRSSPVQVASNIIWTSIEFGGYTSTAIDNFGVLWGWGMNNVGQLGLNDTVSRSAPVQIGLIGRHNRSSPTQVGTRSWSNISAGDLFTAGISNNTLFTWGGTSVGQIMDGSTTSRSSPVQVGGTLSYVMVATLGAALLAVTNNDPIQGYKMISSGDNTAGVLGDNTVVSKSAPTTVLFSIAENKSNPVQITSDDYSGYYESSPVQVGSDSWNLISAGENHSLGTKSSGLLFAWGYNVNGQVGDSTTINKSSPVQISTATTWVDVEAGYNHNVVEKSDGSAYTFGSNSNGQLGDGT